jgi:hypothetical protein
MKFYFRLLVAIAFVVPILVAVGVYLTTDTSFRDSVEEFFTLLF